MKNLVPTTRPVLDFEPVPRKHRYDGWTVERQRAFIAALAETGSVKAAAKRINMSSEGAYYLRRQPGADGFRAAWGAALDHGVQNLVDIAIDRAIEGVPVPIYWRGEQVGEKRWYNDQLLMFNIRHHLLDRYPGDGGPGRGTRSRATIEREATENCPVCRARAAEAGSDADETKVGHAALDTLLGSYAAKVRYERRARLQGDVVAADFAVRQLTSIELMLVAAGAAQPCFAVWEREAAAAAGASDDEDSDAMAAVRLLEAARQRVWREQAALRPHTRPCDGLSAITVPNGEDEDARIAAQHKARAHMAAAQALWEAAATEEGWRKWGEREDRTSRS